MVVSKETESFMAFGVCCQNSWAVFFPLRFYDFGRLILHVVKDSLNRGPAETS